VVFRFIRHARRRGSGGIRINQRFVRLIFETQAIFQSLPLPGIAVDG
jgi:hypothetical protein